MSFLVAETPHPEGTSLPSALPQSKDLCKIREWLWMGKEKVAEEQPSPQRCGLIPCWRKGREGKQPFGAWVQ